VNRLCNVPSNEDVEVAGVVDVIEIDAKVFQQDKQILVT